MADPREDRAVVGRIGRAHGLGGEVTVVPDTDAPEHRFRRGARFLTDEVPPRELEIVALRPHKGGFIVRFAGIDDRTAAEALTRIELTIPIAERRELEPEEFWPDELEGMTVVDPEGRPLGTVVRVIVGPAQDRLVVEPTAGGPPAEIPFVDALVPHVDVDERQVTVDLPTGLLDAEA